jgi:hypothetical protein
MNSKGLSLITFSRYESHSFRADEFNEILQGDMSLTSVFHTFLIFQCSMNLATKCQYPQGYFDDLRVNNDEDLEMERNDVRDVLRGLTSSCDGGQSSVGGKVTYLVLLRLLETCSHPIQEAAIGGESLFPESALHAFSALARPLHSMALNYSKSQLESLEKVLKQSLDVMTAAGRCIIQGFSLPSQNDILPMSRLYGLATASFSPMLSTLSLIPKFENLVLGVLELCIQSAILSLVHLPELTAPSTLRSSRFDIRGAMRSPGGEDHVGALALMRLATESQALTCMFLRTKTSVVIDLCRLYQQLKQMENERGRGILHGKGVLSKSRRILLGVICHLEVTTGGTSGASELLKELFESCVTSIASLNDQVASSQLTADIFFNLCENVFDLAAFSSNMVNTLFNFQANDSICIQATCLNVLEATGVCGYQALHDQSKFTPDSLVQVSYNFLGSPCVEFFFFSHFVMQWNRLRAAIFTLIKDSGAPDLPTSAVDLVLSGIKIECDAIVFQCRAGPKSSSLLFQEDLIAEDVVPPGNLIQALGEILENAASNGIPVSSLTNVIRVLFDSRGSVLHTIAEKCPNPTEKGSFCDPRPVVAETWFLTINKLLKALISQRFFELEGRNSDISNALERLLIETLVAIIALLLYPSLGKTQTKRVNDAGMSFDGPQTLAMMEFLHLFFSLGFSPLQAASKELLKTFPIDPATIQCFSTDQNAAGVSIIGAALFRAVAGGLPPWAVECIPSVYASFYQALNKDSATFCLIFKMSINVRLPVDQAFGGVHASSLLSGRFFETMGDKARHKFLTQAVEHAKRDSLSGWRHLKALIKQACGGKKKDTDFKQKPTFTKWDSLDRL